MENESELLDLLMRERELLLEAETITEQMQTAPAEQLPGLTSRRGRFLEEAQHLRQTEKQRSAGNAALCAALDNTARPDALAPNVRRIYDASMAVRAVISRLQSNSAPAGQRLAAARDQLQVKLDSLQSDSVKTMNCYAKVIRATGGAARTGHERKI